MSKDTALLVAAIDFGTTYSGYAFSLKHEFEQDPLRISASQWTSGSRSNISLKTSSCILFNPRGQFDAFGYEAEDKYSDLALDNAHRDWFYFRRFKMMLYDSKSIEFICTKTNKQQSKMPMISVQNIFVYINIYFCDAGQDVHHTTKIKDETGKEMLAMDVFAAAIRYLMDHLQKACTERMYGGGVNDRDIRWVLTVPAIWDDAAKQFMRESAEKAGIRHESLVLALEPEAASMFCKYLPVERMLESSEKKITCFQPNARYLVLDAGGGTIDITIHAVQANGTLRELSKANGGPWGGTTIDQAFLGFIQSIIGPEVMARFQNDHKDDYIDLLREFEVKKRNVQPDTEGKITFKIPITLHELYRDVNNEEIREAIRSNPNLSGNVTFAGDKMRVEAEVVKSLFEETNSTIVRHIKKLLSDPVANGVTSILMVGGFSESAMLREAVQSAFQNLRVIVPNEAGLAVLKGAVIFGHNSNVIVSRIAKYTYGLKRYHTYDPKVHPKERMIIKDGEQQVRGCFEKLVEVGQSVSPDEPSMRKTFSPQKGHRAFAAKLFASSNKDPLFVDDPGCFPIGEMSVNCLDRKGIVGSASVCLIFGGTELEVRAEHTTTKEQTSASFNFLD